MYPSRLSANARASRRAATLTIAAAAAAATLLCVPAAHAQIVVNNPSFEANAASFTQSPGYVNDSSNNYPGNPSSITGWTSSSEFYGINGPATSTGSPFSNNSGAIPDGNAVAFLQSLSSGPTSISQVLHGLVPGQQYTVSFFDSTRFGDTSPTLTVDFDGTVVYSATTAAVTGSDPYQFVTSSAFTALTNSATLTFTALSSSGDSTALIDNVSVSGPAAAVNAPEPGTLPLLAVTLAAVLPALCIAARRRRHV